MNAFGRPSHTVFTGWDQEKVGWSFYNSAIKHSVFKREPDAINRAHAWLNQIAADVVANEGNPVTRPYKGIQDYFRNYAQSHVDFLRALRECYLLQVKKEGKSRKFDVPIRMLHDGNYRWLHLLLTNAKTRRRNQIAIAKRKKNRTVYPDSIRRIIDEFRYGVKFERKDLVKQLRVDSSHFGPARRRHLQVVLPLIAFETRKFCDLKLNDGKIYHEFTSLPWNYRRFASFKGRTYDDFVGIDGGGGLPCDLFPSLHAFAESLGITLVYESDGLAVFADKKDVDLKAKMDEICVFLLRQ